MNMISSCRVAFGMVLAMGGVLAGPVGIDRSGGLAAPTPYGPQRGDSASSARRHAYSPFDNRSAPPRYQPRPGWDYLEGHLVIKVTPAVNVVARAPVRLDAALPGGSVRLTGDASLDEKLAGLGIRALEPVFPGTKSPVRLQSAATGLAAPDLSRWYRAVSTSAVEAVIEALRGAEGIEVVEPDYLRRLVGEAGPVSGVGGTGMVAGAGRTRAVGLHSIPGPGTDPLYGQQWHLGAAQVPAAWAYLQSQGGSPGGNRDIVVAVIDTGVDYNHPDLAASMWVNSGEIPANGVDDDGNGFVDDVHGCAVVSSASSHSGNPMDDHGHGTHVAGIIAAQAGNGEGGVGVAYNVQVMAIKAAQYSGVLASSDIAEAIQYAVAQGADIINMSFGGYASSPVEEEALAVAFGQAVLVAAAGNDAAPNEPCASTTPPRPMYPAAHDWVLGVMARTQNPSARGDSLAYFSNFDGVSNTTLEYELMAPGVDIWSTLPGGQYASWDGTSMAAPVVSGIAALARTLWSDKDQYSSRFIMGQIATTGPALQGRSSPDGTPVAFYAAADALAALTTVPEPDLVHLEHWLFDTALQSPYNDKDGIADANETIDLAIVIRNRWGKADSVQARLEARAEGAVQADPYVGWVTDTVDYGAVGAFSSDDNGLIYDAQQAITGVEHPFRFTIAADCPNDHVIPFKLTLTARNGLDPGDPTLYTFTSRFSMMVQRGRELPRIISEDMTLTQDYYWLVPDRTLIESGVTVTIAAGTQVQFWSGGPGSPYYPNPNALIQVEGTLDVQGTLEEPVELFNCSLLPKAVVNVTVPGSPGWVSLRYARVRNPYIHAGSVDHCYFTQQSTRYGERPDSVGAGIPTSASNSIYSKISGDFQLGVMSPTVVGNLYDGCKVYLDSRIKVGQGNVFLNSVSGSAVYSVGFSLNRHTHVLSVFPTNVVGGPTGQKTYFCIASSSTFEAAEAFAQRFGGHLVTVNDAAEQAFLNGYRQYATAATFARLYPELTQIPAADAGTPVPFNAWTEFGDRFMLGLTTAGGPGDYAWASGEPIEYTAWESGQPGTGAPYVAMANANGLWSIAGPRTGPWVAEVPGVWSQAQIDAVRRDYLERGSFNTFKNNALLNPWWDANLTHWLRPHSSGSRAEWMYLTDNFWGTTSTTLIDAAIYDYHDDFNWSRYLYQPVLTNAPVECYPFVAGITLSSEGSPDTWEVGAGDVTFTVTFNRDMDVGVPPEVSFGPAAPVTDYRVHPIDGGWQSPRTWTGTFTITPTTGDGYQFIRVAGAVAADDPWLVTGDDAGRFRFEIVTSGTESMNLQATAGEARVDLAWMQDDFDLLAGYNVYRSTNGTNGFTRINPKLIPPGERAFRDTAVLPGKPYWYAFTVVKTDMTESAFSNVAQGIPVDTIPPVIVHGPVTRASAGLALSLFADVTDNVAVRGVTLYFRTTGGPGGYQERSMTPGAANRYAATLEGSLVSAPGLEYYISATDGVSTVQMGRPEHPNAVVVADSPVVTTVSPTQGPALGGTPLTIVGANFKPGLAVTLGGLAAAQVVRVDSSHVTCLTPAHFPAAADVRVTNPDGASGVLLRGFTFESDIVSLSLPATGGAAHDVVLVPIRVANVRGLAAADVTVAFNASVLKGLGVRTGSLTPGWTLAVNTSISGQIRFSMAGGGGTASGEGSLAILEFEVVGSTGLSSTLQIASLALNDGAVVVEAADGSFAVAPAHQVGGKVRYWNGGAPVPGVELSLEGDRVFAGVTDAGGLYTVSGAPVGAYTLTAGKSDGVAGITAFDASLVLRHAAGLNPLGGDAALAADVDKSGGVTAMDAFYILQAAVGLVELPFPGSGRVWDFTPRSRVYPSLTTDMTGQDFAAVLLGDVSGNWQSGGAGLPGTASHDRGGVGLASPQTPVVLAVKPVARSHSAGSRLWVLVHAAEPTVYSLDLTVTLPSPGSVVSAVWAGPMAKTLAWASNTRQPGRVRLALAATVPIGGIGGLVAVDLAGTEAQPAGIEAAVVNEGMVSVQIDQASTAFEEDSDGDGQTDWVEVRAGMDPGNRDSCFALIEARPEADNGVVVTWASAPGIRYQLQSKAAVSDEDWINVGDETLAEGAATSQRDSRQPRPQQRVYRVLLVE